MKISYLFLLSVCTSSIYAAPAPALDSYEVYNAAATSNQILNSLSKLQTEVSQLKTKIADQGRTIDDLKARQAKLENLQSSSSSTVNSGKQSVNLSTGLVDNNLSKTLLGEKTRYEYAYSIFRSGDYNQAIAEFQTIIKNYPTGEYADNSQYWMGEALLKKGDKTTAMKAFDKVVHDYSTSSKVPDALLKLGMTQLSIGNKSKAKEYYDYLIAEYPNSPAATMAYTKRLQAGM